MKKKISISLIALALVLCCTVATTIAWLTSKTDSVVNTFTFGDINITLTETTGNEYKMIPGNTITKDPTVTVVANSEPCWLFVKIEKSANFDQFMTYEIAQGWTALDGNDGVYYREINTLSNTDVSFAILLNNQVTVKDTVTKEMFNNSFSEPQLVFTAYAVQKDNIPSATDAWAKVSN